MKKEGRAIVVVVLLIFFIIAVAVCGYFMIKLDKKEKEMQAVQEDLNQIKEELKNKNEEIREEANQAKETEKNQDVSVDVDALNKEHCERILKIMGAGSFEGKYKAIMKKTGEINYTSDYSKGEYAFKVTDENYSDYEKEWQTFMSKSLFEEILKFKNIKASDAMINVNGKLAINVLMWTGSTIDFVSQKQISKDGNTYIYEVKYKVKVRWDPEEYEEKIANVTGKVEGSNYIIEKFENK